MFSLLALALGLALLDVLPLLPGWLHAAVLALFGAGLVASLVHAWRRFKIPGRDAARHRLEQDSALAHRPLTALTDRQATGTGDQESVQLWQAHRRRLLAQATKLRLGWPRIDLTGLDPYALRGIALLILAVGVIVGWRDWPQRLSAAVAPQILTSAKVLPAHLDAWINPPAYTGLPPLFLDSASGETIETPVGSELLAQVQGGDGVPRLTIGETTEDFGPLSAGSYRIGRKLDSGEWFTISQSGTNLGTWVLALQPDNGPSVEFMSPPAGTERNTLRLDYGATDDFGVNSVNAIIRRIDQDGHEPLSLELPLSAVGQKELRATSYHDLTPHPWAGIAVEITLEAADALGQTGISDPVRTVLPERIFNHPVARALVELRKQLTLSPDDRRPVIQGLWKLNQRPEHFFDDLVVYMAIRSAERRLVHDRSPEAIEEVQELMWRTALHIEEGELALAERELRNIQEALMRALAEGASDEEIDRLMNELRDALNRYLEALAEQLSEQLAEGMELETLPEGAELIEGSELQKMLDRARELAKSGARDAAMEMLSQLQNILENLRLAPMGQQFSQEGQDAWQMLRDLEDLVRNQQDLLDKTYRDAQNRDSSTRMQGDSRAQGEPGDSGREQRRTYEGDAGVQEDLRRQLGDLMQRLAEALGEIPRPLGRAEQAMRNARDALSANRPGDALDPQGRALDQLQQGMQTMVDRFMERLGQNAAQQGTGQVGAPNQRGRDPLGRDAGDFGIEALEGVRIPDQMELRRAGEILQELRRRRGERHRPPVELDYIDRLLRQF